MIILEENFKWHLEAFASELFRYLQNFFMILWEQITHINYLPWKFGICIGSYGF